MRRGRSQAQLGNREGVLGFDERSCEFSYVGTRTGPTQSSKRRFEISDGKVDTSTFAVTKSYGHEAKLRRLDSL